MVVTMRPMRAPALGDQLAELLRDQIVRRQLTPGSRLVEDALAAQYDVSRGPVRDALRQLESQGLVESRRRGFFVVGLSEADIDDLYELRESIELVAIARAIERATPEQFDVGRAIVAEMHACADRHDAADFAAADMEFHALLYRLSGNRRLLDVWESYAPVFASLMRLTVEEDRDLHPSAADHGRLLELIVEGDTDLVLQNLREHLDGARGRMSSAVAGLDRATGASARAAGDSA